MYQSILTELEEGILLISINRPDKLNALNSTVIDELAAVVDDIYTNPAIKGAIITGTGEKAFVAGADISEFSQLDQAGGEALARKGQELVFDRIEQAPKPIIAAVNGFALGGGCELAMACHFRLASENARFGQPEVNLGLLPGYGGTQRLTRLIGKGKAMELMLTGQMMTAAEALQWGLVNYVYSPAELLPKAKSLLQQIISKAPLAITKIIELSNAAAAGDKDGFEREIKAFGELMQTADAKEGSSAFLEKRKPLFKGE